MNKRTALAAILSPVRLVLTRIGGRISTADESQGRGFADEDVLPQACWKMNSVQRSPESRRHD